MFISHFQITNVSFPENNSVLAFTEHKRRCNNSQAPYNIIHDSIPTYNYLHLFAGTEQWCKRTFRTDPAPDVHSEVSGPSCRHNAHSFDIVYTHGDYALILLLDKAEYQRSCLLRSCTISYSKNERLHVGFSSSICQFTSFSG